MPNRSCLTGDTTALDGDQDVEFVQGVAELKGLSDDHSMNFTEEICFEWPTVDLDVASARSHKNSGRGCFSPTRTVILN